MPVSYGELGWSSVVNLALHRGQWVRVDAFIDIVEVTLGEVDQVFARFRGEAGEDLPLRVLAWMEGELHKDGLPF